MYPNEYNALKAIYDKYKEEIPKYKKTFNILKNIKTNISDNKILLFLKSTKKNISNTNIFINYTNLYKNHVSNYNILINNIKKISTVTVRELKRSLSKTSKINPLLKSKKINRELNTLIKKTTKNKEESTKLEEKQIIQNKKKQDEIEEENRQRRKINYILTQTETMANYFIKRTENKEFNNKKENTEIYTHVDVEQPKMLKAKLHKYQLKGLNWLVSLYNQNINGILADDMGLGKTVQSIAFLEYLTEKKSIERHFLVITPTSLLFNWNSEFKKFLPKYKILSYWGNLSERKELRKNIKNVNVILTSYQIAVLDEAFLKKIKYEYMILDEAQAIKSIFSQRFKTLINFKSKNKLLLTGTPIQNNLRELWALLHFIMPSLFDNLNEFSEWFSKEIENKKIDKEEIKRLHTILKPFMLRRHKKDIKNEIGTKEIKNIYCKLSNRQKLLYKEINDSKIDFDNKIMQLKKVCNHPDLFEKIEPFCSLSFPVEGSSNFIEFRSKEKLKIFRNFILKNECRNLNSEICKCIKVCRCNTFTYNPYFYEKENLDISIGFTKFIKKKNLINKNYYLGKKDFISYIKKPKNISFLYKRILKEKVLDFRISTNLKNENQIKNLENITFLPPLNVFVNDSGKLQKLEKLLEKLKNEKHKVLIYFQMTKMMNLFEEFLIEKEYSYLRLDGSCKINSRKEIVNEFQNNKNVFIFILSTRAGGVGLNLTAADTVIFYDSDWNPTVDQQAMDRAHRIGQKKDVTVYKLITKNTIEERIIKKANEKDEIQKIVIKDKMFEGR